MHDPAGRRAAPSIHTRDLLEGLRLGGVGVWRWQVDSGLLMWTDNLAAIHGLVDGFDGTIESFRRDLHPEDADALWRAIQTAVDSKTPFSFVYRTAPGPDGRFRWIEARGGLVVEEGQSWLTGTCMDVSDRVEAERELNRRLKQQKAVEELGSFAFGEDNLQAVAERAVRLAAEVLDVPLTKILKFADDGSCLHLMAGVGWREGLVGSASVGIERESQAGYTLLSRKPVVVEDLASETRFSGPELLRSHRVVSGMSTIIAGDGVRPFGVFGVHTNRKRRFNQADTEFLAALANIVANSARQIAAVEHRSLLVREMAHRAGNMLQLVNTIAHRTFLPDRDLDEARRAFSNRLGSLSRANYLIAKGGWSLTQFSALAEEALEPFRDRVRLTGPAVLLPPELCFDVGLVLHELSTNAAKYGSFASEDGEVEVRWSLVCGDDRKERFQLEWVDAAPLRPAGKSGTGFGTKLMHLIIERKWGGIIEPLTDGPYRFAFTLPLASAPVALDEE